MAGSTTMMSSLASTTPLTGSSGVGGSDPHGGHGGHEMSMSDMKHDMMADMLSTAQRMHYAASVIIGPILVVLGLIGNVLSIVVWSRKGMRSSTGRYLTCLAVADSGVLVMFLAVDTLKMGHPQLENDPVYAAFFAWVGYPFFFLFVILSIWFMVGVTVDRFIMVCLITKAKEYCSESRANVGVALITGLCFLVNLPHFWSHTVDVDRGTNGTGPALVQTEFQRTEPGIRYEFWVHCIFLVLVPWVTIFSLNLFIIKRLSKTNRRMSSKKTMEAASKCKRSENQVTRLLLLVTFTFLLLIGFQCITQCFYMLMPDGFDKRIIDEAFAVAKMGIVINSSINFLLYCFSGRRFRNELLVVLRLRSRESQYTSSRSSHAGTGTTGTSGTSGTSDTASSHM